MNKIICIILLCTTVHLIDACSKDPAIAQPETIGNIPVSPPTNFSYPIVYNRTASNWVTVPGTGVFTSDLGSVSLGNKDSSRIMIFIVNGSKEVQVNGTVNFATGEIWAIIYGMNIKLVYRDVSGNNKIPFTQLFVRIEIW